MDAAIFNAEKEHCWKNDIFEWLSMVHSRSVDTTITMLKGLKRKSLLENLGDGTEKIGMHDLWHEFAVMKSKGGEFDSRPWIYEKVYGLNDKRREESCLSRGGWKSLQRICMDGAHYKGCVVKEIDLRNCSNMRVLKLVGVHIRTEVLDVSSLEQLKSLDIYYGLYSSSKLQIQGLGCLMNLVYLKLVGTNTDSPAGYEEIGGVTSLQVLQVLNSTDVEKLSDLSILNLLRDVVFYFCKSADIMSGLNSRMTNLKRLNLRGCSSLRSCHGLGDLVALEELDLYGCKLLEELPYLGRLKNLLQLNAAGCELIKAMPGLDDLVSLQVIEAFRCRELAEVPDVCKLINLQKLNLRRCPLDKALPGLSDLIAMEALEAGLKGFESCHDLRKLTKLDKVRIGEWDAEESPCLSDLQNLKSLQIWDSVQGVDEFTGLLKLTRLRELFIICCGFKDVTVFEQHDHINESWFKCLGQA